MVYESGDAHCPPGRGAETKEVDIDDLIEQADQGTTLEQALADIATLIDTCAQDFAAYAEAASMNLKPDKRVAYAEAEIAMRRLADRIRARDLSA